MGFGVLQHFEGMNLRWVVVKDVIRGVFLER
jgi:hypothetical protein